MISWTDEIQTILPAARETCGRTPCPIIARAAARAQRKAPVRFTLITVFHCSSVMSVIAASRWRPALLTRMSMPPHARFISANIISTSASFDTSAPGAVLGPLLRRALMGLAMGLTAISLIYSPWGQQSGAHFNPAVTLTFLRLGRVAPWDAALYVGAQFVGGVAGLAVAVVA